MTGQKAIRSSQQARFQIVDMVATMKPLTKLSRQIVSTASIPTIVREAFRVAVEERPGPGAPGAAGGRRRRAGPDRAAWCRRTRSNSPSPPRRRSTAPRDMIRQAQRPLVMLGAAASRPRLGADLGEFLARTRHPVLHHADGQGRGGRAAARAARRPVDGHRGPVRARLRPRGHRPGRPDRGDRPRHGREAAVPHGPGRTDGDPRRLHPGQRRRGLLPARRRSSATSARA